MECSWITKIEHIEENHGLFIKLEWSFPQFNDYSNLIHNPWFSFTCSWSCLNKFINILPPKKRDWDYTFYKVISNDFGNPCKLWLWSFDYFLNTINPSQIVDFSKLVIYNLNFSNALLGLKNHQNPRMTDISKRWKIQHLFFVIWCIFKAPNIVAVLALIFCFFSLGLLPHPLL